VLGRDARRQRAIKRKPPWQYVTRQQHNLSPVLHRTMQATTGLPPIDVFPTAAAPPDKPAIESPCAPPTWHAEVARGIHDLALARPTLKKLRRLSRALSRFERWWRKWHGWHRTQARYGLAPSSEVERQYGKREMDRFARRIRQWQSATLKASSGPGCLAAKWWSVEADMLFLAHSPLPSWKCDPDEADTFLGAVLELNQMIHRLIAHGEAACAAAHCVAPRRLLANDHPFIPSTFQQAILDELRGKALRVHCSPNASRATRNGSTGPAV
jgi:hypothetical protein